MASIAFFFGIMRPQASFTASIAASTIGCIFSAARLGTVKYQEFWVALSAEEKQVIGAVEKRRMYDMSLAVDNAEPVDAAATEDK